MGVHGARVVVLRAHVRQRRGHRHARRRAATGGDGSAGSAAPKPRCSRSPAAMSRSSARDGCSSSYPHPQCLRRRLTSEEGRITSVGGVDAGALPSSVACRSLPASSPAARGTRARWRRAGVRTASSRRPSKSAAADEAIAALEDRGSPAHDGLAARLAGFDAAGDGLRARAPAHALVAATGGRGRVGVAGRAVRDARRGRPLARRPAGAVGRLVGRPLGARGRRRRGGRRGPDRGADPRARGGVGGRARAAGGRGARLAPQPPGDARSARRGCRAVRWSSATPSTTSTRGGRATSRPGPRRPTRRCATWPRCSTRDHLHTPQVPLVRPLGGLPGAARLRARRPPAQDAVRVGTRDRLDRHLAALPRGRPPSRDPALARASSSWSSAASGRSPGAPGSCCASVGGVPPRAVWSKS